MTRNRYIPIRYNADEYIWVCEDCLSEYPRKPRRCDCGGLSFKKLSIIGEYRRRFEDFEMEEP